VVVCAGDQGVRTIFRIMHTHSVASVNADVLTSSGWTTFSSSMSVIVPCKEMGQSKVSHGHRGRRRTRRTLIPAHRSPLAWRFLNSVTVRSALRPAFCASVYGTTSRACATTALW